MQEAEINKNLDHNLLLFPGYSIEMGNNLHSSRVAIYKSKKVDYSRRQDLEGINSNIIIPLKRTTNELRKTMVKSTKTNNKKKESPPLLFTLLKC